MINIEIDGKKIQTENGSTVIEAAHLAGISIPHFCYHKKLSIAANCRMCLVEVEKAPKPLPACATPVAEGMKVFTHSKLAVKAQKGVMEFLLINHPLDCPICDQGGECTLQDLSVGYGGGHSRYHEEKRTVLSKDIGPLVSAEEMSRCINCTRCVRFGQEIAGQMELGQAFRGEHAEIMSFVSGAVESELSGNMIDLCPVGALTSKPYAFTARPWELSKTETIDVMDALGSNIRVDAKGREVMRILPRNHDGVNEEWISDKTRFIWDGLRRQRLDRPYLRENGKLRPATWPEALSATAAAMKGRKVAGLVGDLVPTEAAFALKQLIEGQGGSVECRTDGAKLPVGNRGAYVGTATIGDIDDSEMILLVGTNPRDEAPVLNARIRKAWLAGAEVALIGAPADLTYDYYHAGTGRKALLDMIEEGVSDDTREGKKSLVIVGQGALREADGAAVLAQVQKMAEISGSGLLVLHSAAGRVGAMDVGAVTEGGLEAAIDGAEVIYNLGADEVDVAAGP